MDASLNMRQNSEASRRRDTTRSKIQYCSKCDNKAILQCFGKERRHRRVMNMRPKQGSATTMAVELRHSSSHRSLSSHNATSTLIISKDVKTIALRRAGGLVLGVSYGGGNLGRWPPSPFRGGKRTMVKARESVKMGRKRLKRVLILMSATGGGHRASAQAIKQAFFERYGEEFKVDIVDPITDHSRWPISIMPPSYNFMVRHPWMWWLNYKLSQPRIIHRPALRFVAVYCSRAVAEMYDKYQPDLIVSVHPLLQHAPIRILRQRIAKGLMKPTPFATVVTDFATCHTTWFHKHVQKVFVPTQGIANIAKRMGVKQHQIEMRGLPIRPDFSGRKLSKESMRRSLALKADVPTVLIVGGGEGMGPVEKTAIAIAKRLGSRGQIIIICGRNENLATRLKTLNYGDTQVKVCGFVNNMVDFMCASDCIITKAGPGTIAEALICGLPMILNDYIPCQEADNVPYVLDNGVGIFMKEPEVVALTVAHWFSPEGSQELRDMAKKAKDLGRPEATFRIVEDLASLIPA